MWILLDITARQLPMGLVQDHLDNINLQDHLDNINLILVSKLVQDQLDNINLILVISIS